jgi:hypothetical protein
VKPVELTGTKEGICERKKINELETNGNDNNIRGL